MYKDNIFSIPESLISRSYIGGDISPDYRNDFMRDRDRIMYCTAFRRIAGKTQIYTIGDDDHKKNRLTHSLEVSQIARTICHAVGLNEDLAEAIALGHDLDHKTEVKILEPKTAHSVRTIPLPDVLKDSLSQYQALDAFLLTGDKKRYIEPRVMQKRFKRILKDCGIADANFHTTRHTFATRCVELGFDIKSLSEILGHASVTITMNKYVHPTMELKAENMNRFSGLFE